MRGCGLGFEGYGLGFEGLGFAGLWFRSTPGDAWRRPCRGRGSPPDLGFRYVFLPRAGVSVFSVVVPHPYPNLVPRPFCLQWNTRRDLSLSLSLSLSLYRGRTHTLSTVALFLTHPCEFLHVKLVLLDAWSLTDPFLIDLCCHGPMPTSGGARRGRRAAGRRGGAVGAGGARRGSGRVCVGARGARGALF